MKPDSFDVPIDIKSPFLKVSVTIEPDRSLLTVRCLELFDSNDTRFTSLEDTSCYDAPLQGLFSIPPKENTLIGIDQVAVQATLFHIFWQNAQNFSGFSDTVAKIPFP